MTDLPHLDGPLARRAYAVLTTFGLRWRRQAERAGGKTPDAERWRSQLAEAINGFDDAVVMAAAKMFADTEDLFPSPARFGEYLRQFRKAAADRDTPAPPKPVQRAVVPEAYLRHAHRLLGSWRDVTEMIVATMDRAAHLGIKPTADLFDQIVSAELERRKEREAEPQRSRGGL